jgi:hypothetical protein
VHSLFIHSAAASRERADGHDGRGATCSPSVWDTIITMDTIITSVSARYDHMVCQGPPEATPPWPEREAPRPPEKTEGEGRETRKARRRMARPHAQAHVTASAPQGVAYNTAITAAVAAVVLPTECTR